MKILSTWDMFQEKHKSSFKKTGHNTYDCFCTLKNKNELGKLVTTYSGSGWVGRNRG